MGGEGCSTRRHVEHMEHMHGAPSERLGLCGSLSGHAFPVPRRCAESVPRLFLVWLAGPSGKDSGGVHSSVKERWARGDEDVREAMRRIAALALRGRDVLLGAAAPPEGVDGAGGADITAGPCASVAEQLAECMNANFDARRALYGDAVIGARSLHMIDLARGVGAAAKFAGSGGAVVVLCPGGKEQEDALQHAVAASQLPLRCELLRIAPCSAQF